MALRIRIGLWCILYYIKVDNKDPPKIVYVTIKAPIFAIPWPFGLTAVQAEAGLLLGLAFKAVLQAPNSEAIAGECRI